MSFLRAASRSLARANSSINPISPAGSEITAASANARTAMTRVMKHLDGLQIKSFVRAGSAPLAFRARRISASAKRKQRAPRAHEINLHSHLLTSQNPERIASNLREALLRVAETVEADAHLVHQR